MHVLTNSYDRQEYTGLRGGVKDISAAADAGIHRASEPARRVGMPSRALARHSSKPAELSAFELQAKEVIDSTGVSSPARIDGCANWW